MKVEKEKLLVKIYCQDGSMIKGCVHINPGERLIDFLNDTKENFVAVTDAEFHNLCEIQSFKLAVEVKSNKDILIVNKAAIKSVEAL